MSENPEAQAANAAADGGAATAALPATPPTGGDARSSGPPPAADASSGMRTAPGSRATATAARPLSDRRPSVPRPPATRGDARPAPATRGPRARRARLALRRIDPWSVFLFSFLGSLCLGVVLLVAVAALYAMLSALGVIGSINDVFAEVTGGGPDSVPGAPLLTAGRALGAAGILALIDVVLLTALATLGALLYNLCASLTGGIELTLAEKD